jgi:outer membrane protein assembly factor BamB
MKTGTQLTPFSVNGWQTGLVVGLLLNLNPAGQAADWPQYRGPNHDGISTEKILTQWPAGGLRTLWKVPLNTGFSTFSVSQGKVFTLVRRAVDGADQEVCLALDADSGKELWAAPLGRAKYQDGGDSGAADNRGGDGPRCTPTVDGGRVYVLSAYLMLSCVDGSTGKILWSKDISKEYDGKVIAWQNAASPLIDGDLVFLASTGEGQSLLAFHKTDGSLAWKGQNDKMTHATPVAATILGVRQIIFFAQSGLVSVVPESGAVLWRYPFPYAVSTAASPVVAGDLVYCSAGYGVGGGVAKISKDGGRWAATEVWRESWKETKDKPKQVVSHWSTPVYHDGYLYGMFSFKDFGKGPLKCVELATGKVIWSKEGFGPGGTLLVDKNVLALDDMGNLILIEATPKGYHELARCKAVEGKCWNAPAVSNGRIYARGTQEGACLEASPAHAQR